MISGIMRDYLEQQIVLRRQRLAALERERATLVGELTAYEDALAQSPGGSIDLKDLKKLQGNSLPVFGAWRTILERLAEFKRFNANDVLLTARNLYQEGKLKKLQTDDGVRAQLSIYAKKGIVKRVGGGQYRLTDNAKAALGADKVIPSSRATELSKTVGPELTTLAQHTAGDAR